MTANGMAGLQAGPTEEWLVAPEGSSVAAATAMPQGHCLAVRGDADSAFICLGANLNLHLAHQSYIYTWLHSS